MTKKGDAPCWTRRSRALHVVGAMVHTVHCLVDWRFLGFENGCQAANSQISVKRCSAVLSHVSGTRRHGQRSHHNGKNLGRPSTFTLQYQAGCAARRFDAGHMLESNTHEHLWSARRPYWRAHGQIRHLPHLQAGRRMGRNRQRRRHCLRHLLRGTGRSCTPQPQAARVREPLWRLRLLQST